MKNTRLYTASRPIQKSNRESISKVSGSVIPEKKRKKMENQSEINTVNSRKKNPEGFLYLRNTETPPEIRSRIEKVYRLM